MLTPRRVTAIAAEEYRRATARFVARVLRVTGPDAHTDYDVDQEYLEIWRATVAQILLKQGVMIEAIGRGDHRVQASPERIAEAQAFLAQERALLELIVE